MESNMESKVRLLILVKITVIVMVSVAYLMNFLYQSKLEDEKALSSQQLKVVLEESDNCFKTQVWETLSWGKVIKRGDVSTIKKWCKKHVAIQAEKETQQKVLDAQREVLIPMDLGLVKKEAKNFKVN